VEEKLETDVDFTSIPIIDVGRLFSAKFEDRMALAKEIGAAAHNVGFFYATNHGVDESYYQKVLAEAKTFFDLPMDEKMVVNTQNFQNETVGYAAPLQYNKEMRELYELRESYSMQSPGKGAEPRFTLFQPDHQA